MRQIVGRRRREFTDAFPVGAVLLIDGIGMVKTSMPYAPNGTVYWKQTTYDDKDAQTPRNIT